MESIQRREFLKQSANVVLGSATLGAALAACGSSSSSSSQAAASHSPVRGGTLRAGFSAGAATDTLNPLTQIDEMMTAYAVSLYDGLFVIDQYGQLQPQLASEVSSNSNATVWTIRLRSDVTWHDGTPLTADDLIYTFKVIKDPANPQVGASIISALEVDGMKKLDNLTVQIPFSAPFSTFPQILHIDVGFPVVQAGFNPKKPNAIGTGPFKYGSFSPGVEAVFVRNNDYWQRGLPYVDKLIITNVADEATQVNGLISGQYDIIDFLSAASIATVQSGGGHIAISNGSASYSPFTMLSTQPPFSDVRVRQAFRLLVDRQAMLDQVFSGHGIIGNDLYSIWDPAYDHDLPQRQQDIDQAKSLLKQAGREGLSVQLITAPIAQGAIEMAEVFAQQASAAGVKVNLRQVPASVWGGPNYTHWGFAQDYWPYFYYFPQVAEAHLPTSPFNETHWNNPQFLGLYREALATTNTSMRNEIAHEMQSIFYNEGSYIVPLFTPGIDGYSKNVEGVITSKTGQPFNYYSLKSLWLT